MYTPEVIKVTIDEISSLPMSLTEDNFLGQVVEIIKRNCSLYFVGVYLLDFSTKLATLRAATGEVGQLLISHAYKVSLDKGWIAEVVQLNEIRLVNQNTGDVFGCLSPLNKNSELKITSQYTPYTSFAAPLLPIMYQLLLQLTMQNKPIGILEFQREVNLPVFSLQEIIDFQLVADTLVDRLKRDQNCIKM